MPAREARTLGAQVGTPLAAAWAEALERTQAAAEWAGALAKVPSRLRHANPSRRRWNVPMAAGAGDVAESLS